MEKPGPRDAVAFVISVAVLALEAEPQVAWLAEKGWPLAEELALEFDDGFRLVPVFVERRWMNGTASPALTQISERLKAMGDQCNPDLWNAQALASLPEWDHIRASARAALALLI